ncbi:MAG TPA: hypothetical protein VMS60_02385 [Solirubrobacterales bacterium]|nr:hypothetical protein [Solirubrobacterales bacterium]
MPTRSEQQRATERSSKCPRCNKFILFTHTYEFGGEKKRTISYPKDPATVAECPRCHGSWFYFERPATIEIVKGERSVEPAFTEELTLDNSKGANSLKRSQSISREWTKEVSLEGEQVNTEQSTFGVAIQGVSLGAMAEQAIRSKHSLSEGQKQTYTDTLDFEVPVGVRRRVVLTFKHNWQHGKLVLAEPDGDSIEIPYKVVDFLTMDVSQQDEQVA